MAKTSPATDERTRQAHEYLKCASDPVFFIDRYVYISHKVKGIIPFHLWRWQADLLDTIHREQYTIVLKGRQLGVSELAVCYALWLVRFHPTKDAIFLSKNEEDAKDLLRRAKLAYTHLPTFLQCGTPESIDTTEIADNNTSRFVVAHLDAQKRPHPSSIRSLPATEGSGRSSAGSFVLLDEWAHQQYAEEIWAAIQPTIATGGKILGVSTANGLGNPFEQIWHQAEAKRNSFVPMFLPWNMHPERDQSWYDTTAANLGSAWRMHQEHPREPTEAFIQSGRPVFDQTYLAAAGRWLTDDERRTPLSHADGLTVWEEPQGEERDARGNVTAPAHQYVIGADVAEGDADGDYDAAVVIDRTTGAQVAELHGLASRSERREAGATGATLPSGLAGRRAQQPRPCGAIAAQGSALPPHLRAQRSTEARRNPRHETRLSHHIADQATHH